MREIERGSTMRIGNKKLTAVFYLFVDIRRPKVDLHEALASVLDSLRKRMAIKKTHFRLFVRLSVASSVRSIGSSVCPFVCPPITHSNIINLSTEIPLTWPAPLEIFARQSDFSLIHLPASPWSSFALRAKAFALHFTNCQAGVWPNLQTGFVAVAE